MVHITEQEEIEYHLVQGEARVYGRVDSVWFAWLIKHKGQRDWHLHPAPTPTSRPLRRKSPPTCQYDRWHASRRQSVPHASSDWSTANATPHLQRKHRTSLSTIAGSRTAFRMVRQITTLPHPYLERSVSSLCSHRRGQGRLVPRRSSNQPLCRDNNNWVSISSIETIPSRVTATDRTAQKSTHDFWQQGVHPDGCTTGTRWLTWGWTHPRSRKAHKRRRSSLGTTVIAFFAGRDLRSCNQSF